MCLENLAFWGGAFRKGGIQERVANIFVVDNLYIPEKAATNRRYLQYHKRDITLTNHDQLRK